MKGSVNIDLGKPAIDVQLQIASIEDVDRALTSIQNAARALWPEIVFKGEDGFAEAVGDDEAVELPSPQLMRQKIGGGVRTIAPFAGGAPAPGSFSARVLELAQAGTTPLDIADALDATTAAVGASLARLRRAGLLAEAAP